MSRRLIVNDGQRDRELLLVDTIVVGRDPECDFSDTGTLLSRRHAEFSAGAAGVRVRDLGSRNGVFLNGARVAEGLLRSGDTVQIGHLRVRFLEDGVPLPAAIPAPPPLPVEDQETRVAWPSPITGALPLADPRPTPVAMPVPPPIRQAEMARVAAVRPAAVAADPRRWTRFVVVRVVAAAGVAFLAAAVPLLVWQTRIQDATAQASASTLVHWLSADAAAAFRTDGPVATSADAVSREPGVVDAVVLSPEGRVLAPGGRTGQVIRSIPGVGASPDSVRRLEWAWNGGRLEIVRPVEGGDGRQVAIAWITFQPPAQVRAATVATWLALPAVIVLLATWVVGAEIGRRAAEAWRT